MIMIMIMMKIGMVVTLLALGVVHAGELVALPNEDQNQVFQEPAGCLKGSSYCAVRTSVQRKFKWDAGDCTLLMDWQTLLLRLESGIFRLISGNLWIHPRKGVGEILTVETESAKFSSRYEFWVRREEDQIVVLSVRGPVEVQLRGDPHTYVLEAGFQNWISGVTHQGRAQMGIPRAIEMERHIEIWARLFPGSRTEFRSALEQWRPIWRNAVSLSALIHQELVRSRELAMEKQHRAEQASAKRRVEDNQKLRELFRQKVLFQ